MPATLGIAERYTPSSRDSLVGFTSRQIDSAFFKDHVRPSAYACYKFSNSTACQLLANLCTMTLHDNTHPACALMRDLQFKDRMDAVPELFFPDGQTKTFLEAEAITNVYRVWHGDNNNRSGH